jgi:CRISPR-associated protein Cas5d
LGCREFAAEVEPAPEQIQSAHQGVDRPLGLLFFDFEHDAEVVRPLFFDARLRNGIMHIPTIEEVRRQSDGSEASR